jgi:hypothetical protein
LRKPGGRSPSLKVPLAQPNWHHRRLPIGMLTCRRSTCSTESGCRFRVKIDIPRGVHGRSLEQVGAAKIAVRLLRMARGLFQGVQKDTAGRWLKG